MASSKPIFVRVRNDQGEIYPSYDIIWKLINWNFPSCELDEVDPESDNTYIFTPDNGNVKAGCERPHKAKYILWQLEIPGQVSVECPPYFDEMWVSCNFFRSLVPSKCKLVVLGGDARLAAEPSSEKLYDFCHLAYLYGKRAQQVAELEAKGYIMAPAGFGEMRDSSIAHSKWGLILHQNPVPALSPQRMTLFACRKLPMIAEPCHPYPYQVTFINEFDPAMDLSSQAEVNYKLMTEKFTFSKCVKEALK